MLEINTNDKYVDGEPNAYYKEFVSDNEFYNGYMMAVRGFYKLLEVMPSDLFGDIEIQQVRTCLIQTAARCAEYLEETTDYNVNEMIISLIDKMSAGEWSKKRNRIFDDEKHDVCSEGTKVSL